MKNWFYSFIVAVQFLTRIPLLIRVPYTVETVSRSIIFYPIVGAVIGYILFIVSQLIPKDAAMVNSAILLLLWVSLTGGLHLDGLMDTADGLGSHRSPEQMRSIMKDSRVGAFGVLAAFFILLLKWTALYFLLQRWQDGLISDHILLYIFLLVPNLSRWWMGAAIVWWPYIGGENGLGKFFKEAKSWYIFVSSIYVIISVLLLLPAISWISMIIVSLLFGWLFNRYVMKHLGGLTGDTYGALNEIVEMVGLICAVYVSVT